MEYIINDSEHVVITETPEHSRDGPFDEDEDRLYAGHDESVTNRQTQALANS